MPKYIICPQCTSLEGHIITPGINPGLCTVCGTAMVATEDDPAYGQQAPVEPEPDEVEPESTTEETEEAEVEDEGEEPDLEEMDVDELRPMARDLGVKDWWNMRKSKLIKAIRKAR